MTVKTLHYYGEGTKLEKYYIKNYNVIKNYE
jgi:hypothetical protein